VNTAARIAAVGHGGQLLLSAYSADILEQELGDDDLSLRDLGGHRLKDLDGEQRLYQVVIPELPSDFPPPRTARPRPNNHPVPLTPFVGRARLVAQVRDLLLQPANRAATLLGPGGTGKTRLAIRVATELLHNMPDGAFFISLAPIHDSSLVIPEIAKVLDVPEDPGRPLLEVLCEHLADLELLLVLDNFEQVQDAAKDIAEILRNCGGIKILATSRQPLRISGERGVPVPPLALPEPGHALPLDEVAGFEAVRLFVDRAQAVRFDFELAEENMNDVVEICRRVDSLPLAIELATARLYELSTQQLLAALEERLNVLTEGAVDLLDHQRTLRDLVAWSYDLLSPGERRLWRRLAVFVGGCELDAAAAVCDPEQTFDMEQAADELSGKSLLNLAFPSGSEGAIKVVSGTAEKRRIGMLETLREFALEQLESSDEADRLHRHHADWFVDLAETIERTEYELRPEVWIGRLDREQANFRAAFDRSLNHLDRPESAQRMGASLRLYWYQRGMFSEGRDWLARSVEQGSTDANEHRGAALVALADLERNMGNIEEARGHGERALDLYRELDHPKGIPDAARELGAIYQHLEEFERASELLEEALTYYRGGDNQEVLSYTLLVLGGGKQLQGDLEGAEALFEEALELTRRLDDPSYLATALLNLGELKTLRNQNDEAADLMRESLKVYADLEIRNAVAYCLEMLAAIDQAGGRSGEAVELFGAAAMIREEIGAPLESFNLERYNQDLDACRASLSPEEFDEHWNRGCSLTMAEAVELAQMDFG
jgi:predicted ATPase